MKAHFHVNAAEGEQTASVLQILNAGSKLIDLSSLS